MEVTEEKIGIVTGIAAFVVIRDATMQFDAFFKHRKDKLRKEPYKNLKWKVNV